MMDVIRHLEAIDWNFKRCRPTGIYNIHWFPGSYIPQIPSLLIAHLTEKDAVVLDPFFGSGTTLVESARLGRIAMGSDLNPLAYLITKVKMTYIEISKLNHLLESAEDFLKDSSKTGVNIPDFPNRDYWFHPDTLAELTKIYGFINFVDCGDLRDLLLVCLSAILARCCTQRDHYTYIADNMFPKITTNITYVNAISVFNDQLRKTIRSLSIYYADIERQGLNPRNILSKASLHIRDAKHIDYAPDQHIDIIVTSPPYANVSDYTTGNRLSFYCLPFSDFVGVKNQEIGARWKRFRKNAVSDYITEMRSVFREFHRVLKPGGYLCCVFGQSSSIPAEISIKERFCQLLVDELGFRLLSDKIERVITGKRIRAVRGVNTEHVTIFQK